MLHDRHELNGIIAECRDAWENILCELVKCPHAALFSRHSDVGLINSQAADLRCTSVLKSVGMGGQPELCRKIVGRRVLYNSLGIRRDAVRPILPVSGDHMHFDPAAVG